jgi:hypothetical protein
MAVQTITTLKVIQALRIQTLTAHFSTFRHPQRRSPTTTNFLLSSRMLMITIQQVRKDELIAKPLR